MASMSTRRSSRRQTAVAARARKRKTTYIMVGIAVVLILTAVIWFDSRARTLPDELQGRVEVYASEGAAHVAVGEQVTYETNPPNSGSHYARWAPPGFYYQAIDDEIVVHNLEHGHIVVFYKPESLTSEDEAYISTLTKSYTGQWDAIIAVPRPNMDHPYVLAAWRHLLPLDTLERETLEAFSDAYRGRGPENPVR